MGLEMKLLSAYIPMDRRLAIADDEDLSNRTHGSALFTDISGYTALVETLLAKYGRKAGVDKGTQFINQVFERLIFQVHQYRGSVIAFGGDALTCWFDGDDGLQAIACGLAMQRAMADFAQSPLVPEMTKALKVRVSVTSGSVRRFCIGDNKIRLLDILAGKTIDRVAEANKLAEKDKIVVGAEVVAQLGEQVVVTDWRSSAELDENFALVPHLSDKAVMNVKPWTELLPSETEVDILTEEEARPWFLPPVYDRIRMGQPQLLDEYRPVVVLFIGFGGLAFDQDDLAGEKLDRYIQWVGQTLARYEGHLIKLSADDKGCNLMATFGAPLASFDDINRAVTAALTLREIPSELDFITGVKIGITRGQMLAGAFGSLVRCAYDLLGDEANIAARLMHKAKPGQILVTGRVAKSVVNAYDINALGLQEYKGKSQPIPVFEIIRGRLPLASSFKTRLVAREKELAQLSALLDLVKEGRGQVIRLEGEAGVGKSHLAVEFAEQASRNGFKVVVGTCQSIHRDTPYYPWRQILHNLLELRETPLLAEDRRNLMIRQTVELKARIEAIDPSWLELVPLLRDPLGFEIPDTETTALYDDLQLRQGGLFVLIWDIIQARAQTQPLLMLIEDAHWLDEVSSALISALSSVLTDTPVALVMIQRPPNGRDQPILPELARQTDVYHHINLQPLASSDLVVLLTERLQGRPTPLLISLFETLTQGNPFFVEELIRSIRQSGGLSRGKDNSWDLSEQIFDTLYKANYLEQRRPSLQWVLVPGVNLSALDIGIPYNVKAAVLSRIDPLSEPIKQTLKVAGVIGRPFDLDLLAHSHPARPDQRRLAEEMADLERQELIQQIVQAPAEPTYSFRHHIIQKTVYDTLFSGQRRDLHETVANALEHQQPEAVEELAQHYRHSQNYDKALFYTDKAASKAKREYANEAALNYFNQALDLAEKLGQQNSQRCLGQVEVLHILGKREQEEIALETLESSVDAPTFETAYLWGKYYEATGDFEQAQSAVERALTASQSQNSRLNEVRCLAQLALIARQQGNYDEAKTRYNQALSLVKEEKNHSDEMRQVQAHVLNGSGTVYRQEGEFERARDHYQEALTLSKNDGNRLNEAEALNNLGVNAFYLRDFDEALLYFRLALEIRQEIGDRVGEEKSLYSLAMTTRDAGDYGQSKKYLSAALPIAKLTGNRWDEVNILNDLGILYQELGDLPRARSYFQDGKTLAEVIGDHVGRAYHLCNLGLVLRDQSDLTTAEQVLTEGFTLFQKENNKYEMSFFLSYLATVSLQAGNIKQAIEQAQTALSFRQEKNMRLNMTDDLATLAAAYLAADQLELALGYAQQALAILAECGGEGPETPQRDYFICYRVLTTAGRTEAARAALQSAYNIVLARAKKISDPNLRQSFLERVAINRQIGAEADKVIGSDA